MEDYFVGEEETDLVMESMYALLFLRVRVVVGKGGALSADLMDDGYGERTTEPSSK